MIKERLGSVLLVIGIFYFSFMILDRVLSIIYGFNFQPYGSYAPPGFTFWGHIGNGSAAALGLFLTFKLYDYATKRRIIFLRILPLLIFAAIGALIPYFADSEHLAKNNMSGTLPVYLLANDLYVFLTGVLAYRVASSNRIKAITVVVMIVIFVCVHFLVYAPMFPEFYWS
jgi:hypothetical protein